MPPKGMYGCGAQMPHVDADHAHVGVAAELFGIELALREDARAVAEFGLPDEFEGVVDVRDFDRGDQRAEHFSREQRVAGGHVLDDRGADEIAVLVFFGQFGVAAVEDEFAAVSVVQGDIHVFLHLVGGGTGNQGSHVHVGIKRVADFDLLGGFDHAFEHGVVQFGHDGHDGPGEAALARGAVAGVDVVFDENVDVGVFHDHKHVFRAAEQHGALGASGAAVRPIFLAGRVDRRGTRPRCGGSSYHVAGDVAAAVDDVDDAAGQADSMKIRT